MELGSHFSDCNVTLQGTLTNPGCTVEPQCRDFSTFGQTFCMRDHYYELWDLEKNFGEKVMCENNGYDKNKNENIALEDAMLPNGAWNDRAQGATLGAKVRKHIITPVYQDKF